MSLKNLPNWFMLGLLHSLGAIPVPRSWMYHTAPVLYFIAVLYSGIRRLNGLTIANIKHAFPGQDQRHYKQVYRNFWRSQIYAAIFESPIISHKKYVALINRIYASADRPDSFARVDGLEHLQNIKDRPVIFSLAHMHSLEVAVLATTFVRDDLHYLSKETRVKFYSDFMLRNRKAIVRSERISHRDIREAYKHLKSGGSLAFLGDQFVKAPNPVEVMFFNTRITAQPTISKLATRTGAEVVPVYIYRNDDLGYEISIKAPLELSPDDHRANTQQIFWHYEQCIRRRPEQYIWNHNRFFRDDPDQAHLSG